MFYGIIIGIIINISRFLTGTRSLSAPAKEKYSIKLSSQAIKPEMSIPTFNKGTCKNMIKLKSM